jgi:hypothetical protein
VKDDVDLCPFFRQAQLVDSTVDRESPSIDPQRALVPGEEKREAELASLDKVNGHAVRLGTGPQAGGEEPAYRCGEGGFRVHETNHRRGGREPPALLFLSCADKFVAAEGGPVRVLSARRLHIQVPK